MSKRVKVIYFVFSNEPVKILSQDIFRRSSTIMAQSKTDEDTIKPLNSEDVTGEVKAKESPRAPQSQDEPRNEAKSEKGEFLVVCKC